MDSVSLSPNVGRVNSVTCENAEQQLIREDSLQEELQNFWSQEIRHFQQHETHHRFCSSLEQQLLYDAYFAKPAVEGRSTARKRKKVFRQRNCEQGRVIRGDDVNDIPTTYLILGLQTHEIPVIGTYVDKSIVPGFKYKVRLNGTKKFHFGGRALRLLSIGPGYGKRLTFEKNLSVENGNYFWSDNHPEGYGFALGVVSEGDRLLVQSPNDKLFRNVVEIIQVVKPQRELEGVSREDGSVVKTVQLSLLCRRITQDASGSDGLPLEFHFDGVATVVRPKGPSAVARVQFILSCDASRSMELLPIHF